MVQPMRRCPFHHWSCESAVWDGLCGGRIRGANNQRIRDYGHDKLKVLAWAVIKAMNIG